MTKALGVALAWLVGLAGCGMRDGWVKPAATEQERKVALYECERDMRVAVQGPPFFRRCMEAKGYTQEK